jgi:4-amino-4-deoxy-L-arabinose transferase-like glycosyltransferase
VIAVWACFLARLLFYSAMLPLWEGYDEWAHFAVVREMAIGGHLLVSRDAPIPRDVEASLQLAPVPWELRSMAPPSVTQDAYWSLTREERESRERALRTMPAAWGGEAGTGALKAYEALQPPLYYWTMAPALWLCRGCSLLGQVLALRFFSSLVASFAVPLVFLIGLEVWDDGRAALGCAAIVAAMPGLALDVARVGNDCLAVVLFTLLTWLGLKTVREGLSRSLAIATGIALGLGLLTKAYFLTAIPAVLAVWVYCRWGRRLPLPVSHALLAAAIGAAGAGWWYLRNLRTTGTLSGLSESVTLRGVGAVEMFRQAADIPWPKAIDAIFLSHLYFGGWSSLTVRSWMYHVFYLAILASAVGLVRLLGRPAILTLLAVDLGFWLGQFYNVVILYMSKGLAGSMGWYMYAVVGAEVVLCVAGLRRLAPARAAGWIAGAGAAMFALLDLYTVHGVAIPYYTGMIQHRANGSLAALHGAGIWSVGIGGAVERLAGFLPAPVLVALWLLYLVGTAGVLACACAGTCDGVERH